MNTAIVEESAMPKVRVAGFSVSLDGFSAGIDLHALGFSVTDRQSTEYATHLVLEKA
jgi:enoyl-CoA hydratase/carnithine racemase